jgi:hypothetical protein
MPAESLMQVVILETTIVCDQDDPRVGALKKKLRQLKSRKIEAK